MGCGNGEMQASYAGKEPPVRLPWRAGGKDERPPTRFCKKWPTISRTATVLNTGAIRPSGVKNNGNENCADENGTKDDGQYQVEAANFVTREPWLSAVANLTRPSVVLFPAMLGKSSFHFQTRSSQGYEFNFTYGV